ncbi:MAG: hypothetical protein ACRDLN_03620 [Solirubrobacteraceae bacterium]
MIELTLIALAGLLVPRYGPATARHLVAADLATARAVAMHPATYEGAARVLPNASERIVVVSAGIGPRTVVRYTWILSPRPGTTAVELTVELESRGPRYSLGLLLGGTRWLRRRLEAPLDRITRATLCAAEGMDADPGWRTAGPALVEASDDHLEPTA